VLRRRGSGPPSRRDTHRERIRTKRLAGPAAVAVPFD
jgi:hypothetical protein